jgi:uncharacterized membrane protein YiaA
MIKISIISVGVFPIMVISSEIITYRMVLFVSLSHGKIQIFTFPFFSRVRLYY